MNITYTGRKAEIQPKDHAKLEGKLAKVAKIIERRGEKEAHVIFSLQRHLHHVEITMNMYDRALVGEGSSADQALAMSAAIEKLEKQIMKVRAKRRDSHRGEAAKPEAPAVAPVATKPVKTKPAKAKLAKAPATAREAAVTPKVFRVNHQHGRKPMTLEEATLELTDGPDDYLVYRDAVTNRTCTLLRRGDGHLDLIES